MKTPSRSTTLGLTTCTLTMALAIAGPALARTGGDPQGYLEAQEVAQLSQVFPAAPTVGSPQDLADKTASAQYRLLEDSERWLLATNHSVLSPPQALQHFDCTLGFRLSTAEAPRLNQLMTRLLNDANGLAELIKTKSHRARPVGDDAQRRACQRLSPAARASASYPSGSAAVAAAYGEAMADLVPEQGEALRGIAHQVALSRLVCGMHYPTDVAVGEDVGRTVFKQVSASPTYRADIEAARLEIDAARALGQTNPACAAERSALHTPLG